MSKIKLIVLSVVAISIVAAATSASASAFNFEWEVQKCELAAFPKTGSFEDSNCEHARPSSEYEESGAMEKLAPGREREVVSKNTTTFELTEGANKIKCTTVRDEGWIENPGAALHGRDLAHRIAFTGCTTATSGCEAHSPGQPNGTIVVKNVKSKLEEGETTGSVKLLADEFEGGPGFVKIEFEGASCAGAGYTNTEVTGNVWAEVSGETLVFPSPALVNSSLKAFGKAATLTGTEEQKGEGRGKIKAS